MKTLEKVLKVEWTGNEYIDNPDFVKVKITQTEGKKLIEIHKKLQGLKKLGVKKVSINCNGELLDSDMEPSEFRDDVNEFVLYAEGGIHFFAQHKYDSAAQLETESFNIKELKEFFK